MYLVYLMRNGTYVATHVPFGFRREDGQLVIDENEAVYVRYLFSRYLAGANAHEIAEEFLQRSENEPVLSRRKWTHRTVIEMLINEKYTGDVLHQKTYMTETLPRQCVRNHGQMDQYYVSSVHPAIIDRYSFQAAQELLQKRKKDHPPHRQRASVFIGTAVCAKCGGGFRSCESSGKRYCVCRRHAHNADACDMPPIPEDAIMQAFLRLYDNLKHGEILQFTQKTLSTIRSRKMLWSTDIVELNQRISDLSSQSHKLSSLNRRGMVDPDIFIAKSNQLAEQLRSAKQQKEQFMRQEDRSILDSTEQLLETMEAGPEVLEAFDEELFCELIDKIIVESNLKIRFRLKNGLELPETIERTVR